MPMTPAPHAGHTAGPESAPIPEQQQHRVEALPHRPGGRA